MAQINPNAYPTAYKISHVDSDGTTPLDIEFSYDLATLVIEGNISMDTVMDGSNSYGGFDASAHNYWVGGSIYGRAQGNPNDPAYGGVSWSSHQVENPKQNLRWFLKITSSASTPQGENPVRWTPQLDDDELTPTYNPDNEQSMVSAMTNNTIRLKEGGIYSLFYTMYPITKIDLDKIQLYPAFTVIRYAFTYNEDDIITGVTSTVSRYHWNDIKPEDNTAAGANYNADLWQYGFYDEMDSENPYHVKYRYVVDSCYVEQYYWSGKRSASGSGKLSAKINNTAWDFSGDAVLPSNTGYNNLYGYLVPLSEGVFNVGGVSGVMINPVSGLIFGGTATNMNKYISFDTSKTDSMYYRDVNGQGTTMIASPTTTGTGFTLKNDENDMATASVIISQPYGSLFGAAISPDYDLPSHYELRDNGAILRINQSSNRNVIGLVNAPFPIEKLWQSLASLGVYVVGTSSIPSGDFVLGRDFPSWLYHGEVLSDGTTTGVMIQGEDIEDLPNWDTIDYEPVIPTPTPPGTEGEESGDRIPNNERYFSGAYNFVTQYAMTRQQLGQFGNLLWSSWADQQGITDMWKNFKMFISADPASDTGSIDIASVMDFILSLQVFPFDLSSLLHTDSANVCIGTGQYPLAVSGKKLLTINHILDCGTRAIPRPYNDFRDYENMSITAYLPYCGSVELNPGDVVGRSVSIEYSVDTLSGSCTAVLTAHDDDGYLYNVGMINGQISASIPMTATNSGQIRAQRISDVASLAGLAGNTFLGNITQGSSINPSGVDSNPIGAISSLATGTVNRSFNSAMSAQQMFANRFSRGAISCPTLAGGNGIAAFFQPACPYIQMRYGLYQKPDNYDHSVGGVSATSAPLSNYEGSGFTVCENVDISGFTCHEEERSAIKALLESGVYL